LTLLAATPANPRWTTVVAGAALVAAGQALRFWAVKHIGVISRTRTTTRVGPLVTTGPYGLVRNPLYVGNWLLWTGFIVWARVYWMLPVAWGVFALQYGLISRWEEQVLHRNHENYVAYAAAVGRWVPRLGAPPAPPRGGQAAPYHWSHVLFSERGTLAAVIAMSLLLGVMQWVR
jgi:protein-S-isoprenylcysteine O-methyltransferase Ste14